MLNYRIEMSHKVEENQKETAETFTFKLILSLIAL